MSSLLIGRELLGALIALEEGLVRGEDVQTALNSASDHPEEDLLDRLARVAGLSPEQRRNLNQRIETIAPAVRESRGPDTFEMMAHDLAANGWSTISAISTTDADQPNVAAFAAAFEPPTLLLGTPSGRDWVYTRGESGPKQRFQEKRPLNEGGLGILSVALDVELRRDVALKKIKPDVAHESDHRARFLLEAEVTGQLEHPAIVPVYSLGYDDQGNPYYAMRLIRGETLLNAIRRYHHAAGTTVVAATDAEPAPDVSAAPPPTLRQLVGRFVTVCQAVEYAHSRDVIHRDIKPSNILLGPYGETLLVDWGMAKVRKSSHGILSSRKASAGHTPALDTSASGEHTLAGAIVGTPGFMSPEQALGQNDHVDARSDVYGLGATLFTLIAGRTPFPGNNPKQISERAIAADFQPTRPEAIRLDPALDAIAFKAMARRPEDRYDSAQALADELVRWLDGEPVLAHRESFTRHASRWLADHRSMVTGLAAAGVAGLIALGALAVVQSLHTRALVAAAKQQRASQQNTRKLVNLMFSEVARSISRTDTADSFSNPQPPGYRQFQLEEAFRFYQQILPHMRDDSEPESQLDFARASADLSRVISLLQSKSKALPPMRLAVKIDRERIAEKPEDTETLKHLIITLYDQSVMELELGQLRAARSSARAALIHLEALARLEVDPPAHKIRQAKILAQLATISAHAGQLRDAVSDQRTAVTLIRQALETPDYPREWRELLANALTSEAHSRLGLQDSVHAEPLYREALELREALYDETPDSINSARELASIHVKLGIFERHQRNLDAAIAHWDQSLRLMRRIVAFDDCRIDDRCRLAQTLTLLAEVHDRRADSAQAASLWDEAHSLLSPILNDNPDLELPRLTTLQVLHGSAEQKLRLGDPQTARLLLEKAISVARELNVSSPEVRQGWNLLAFCLECRARAELRLAEFSLARDDAREALAILARGDRPDLNPLCLRASTTLADATLHTGETRAALEALKSAETIATHLDLKSPREARRLAEILLEVAETLDPDTAHTGTPTIAELHDRAIAQLEVVQSLNALDQAWLDGNPRFDSIRHHPAFVSLRHRLDYPPNTPAR